MEPQVEVVTTQQTPNPAAQDPLAVPLLPLHSEEVRHVPIVEVSVLLVHSSLGNWTTLNNDNCSKDRICYSFYRQGNSKFTSTSWNKLF